MPIGKDVVSAKLERLARDGKPRVLDLFAGCGCISLGFQALGCELVAAVEIDSDAAASHALNFYRDAPAAVRELYAKPRDITQIEPEELVREIGLGPVDEAIDVIVGGPPCQAHARVGRAKLREVAEHPEAFKVDPRGNLYLCYLHYVSRMKPLAILTENVQDIMNYGGHNVAEEVAETLDGMGYEARYSLLNAAFYGVPQMWDRVILLAVRKELGVVPAFPSPTRHMVLPSGYDRTRAVAYKNVGARFVTAPTDEDRPFAVTAAEAIGDLPPITLHLEGRLKARRPSVHRADALRRRATAVHVRQDDAVVAGLRERRGRVRSRNPLPAAGRPDLPRDAGGRRVP